MPAEILDGSAISKTIRQEVKAILFADVVGFNDLPEEKLPVFNGRFLGSAAGLLDRWISRLAKKNVRSLQTGPPIVPPNRL